MNHVQGFGNRLPDLAAGDMSAVGAYEDVGRAFIRPSRPTTELQSEMVDQSQYGTDERRVEGSSVPE